MIRNFVIEFVLYYQISETVTMCYDMVLDKHKFLKTCSVICCFKCLMIEPSIIKLKRQFFRTDPRIEPKFGTQVRIDTITLIG